MSSEMSASAHFSNPCYLRWAMFRQTRNSDRGYPQLTEAPTTPTPRPGTRPQCQSGPHYGEPCPTPIGSHQTPELHHVEELGWRCQSRNIGTQRMQQTNHRCGAGLLRELIFRLEHRKIVLQQPQPRGDLRAPAFLAHRDASDGSRPQHQYRKLPLPNAVLPNVVIPAYAQYRLRLEQQLNPRQCLT